MPQITAITKLTAIAAALLFCAVTAIAAPSFGEEEGFRQPDGTEVTVRVWGDEFYHRIECRDGYTLVRDAERWLVYAKLADDGSKFVPTEVRYTSGSVPPSVPKGLRLNESVVREIRHRAMEESGFNELMAEGPRRHPRALKAGRANGVSEVPAPIEPDVVVGLVIPVEFADVKALPAHLEEGVIHDFFNREGGIGGVNPAGSVRDYFLDVSNGLMDYSNVIAPLITLPHNKDYYDYGEHEPRRGARTLITDALNILNDMGFDLSGVTTENNIVVALNIFHAGIGVHDGMWLHAATYSDGATVNGIGFGRYQISSMNTGNNLSGRLALVIHENGHSLMRWPDLYDHGDLNMLGRGIGNWCVMANQTSFPQQPSAFLRYQAGWIDAIDITNATLGAEFTHEANDHTAYVYWKNEEEGYFIEARRREGIRNQGLPGSGLAIWHAHTEGSNSSAVRSFPRVALIQADGRNDLENRVNRGDATDLFRLGLKTKFNSSTVPAAIYHDGTLSDFSISSISDSGAVMSFKIGDGDYDDKMSAKYKFYNDVISYATSTGNVEAVVDESFTLSMLVNVPAPRTEGITLTIRSATTTPVTLMRGVSGNLFAIPNGAKVILENVIIDGGGNAKFDDEECVEVFEDGILISGCDDDDDDDGEGEGEFAGGAGGSLVRINAGGTLVMNAGAVLRNNIYSSGGGGVNIRNGGTFTMNNGEISGNTSTTSTGGGVVIQSGGTFTMHNGKISDNTSSGGGGVRVVGNATFTMNNGEISSNTSTSSGGGVSVAGTFIMANGKINGNTAVADGGGVRVSGTGSTFTMINGEISGNTAGANAGGVRAASNGTFTMQGGKITNNTGDTYGGGVNAGSSFFIMTGGEITDNTANTGGGGVRVSSGTVTIGGTSVVTNNVGGTTLATDNVLLANNQYINVGEPAEGMNVGITKAVTNNGGMFVQSGALPAHTQYFFDDTAVREITHHNGALFIGHHFYSQVATYTTAETNVIIEVEQDFTLDRLVSIPAPTTEGITLTIRSKDPDEPVTLTRGAGGNLFTIGSGRTLILENIIIDGGRTGSFADGSNGATLLRVNANGTLIMNSGTVLRNNITDYGAGVRIVGGTFTMNDGKINGNTATSTSSTGGGVRIESSGVFTMHGGEISGNSTGNGGGGVGVSSGTFTMNDGKISSNTGPNGGVRVSSGAIFTMNGGEVSGNTISSGATGVSLQSSTAIFNLNSGVVAGTGANTAAIVNGTYNLNLGEAPSPNNALIIAWNKPAGEGPFEYTRGTTTNLITLPTETATATWETQNNTLGIAYKNGNNEGFIEINGVTMKTHTITFDNGSSTEAEKQTIAAGDKATKPTDPTKEGFTFKGWYIGEEEFDFDAPITASITLTAKWAETTPIIANQVNPLIKRITVQTKSNAIILTNLPHNAKVEVYNLKGERVHSQFSILNSQLTIKVQTKGIYIVKIDTQTFRVPVK